MSLIGTILAGSGHVVIGVWLFLCLSERHHLVLLMMRWPLTLASDVMPQ